MMSDLYLDTSAPNISQCQRHLVNALSSIGIHSQLQDQRKILLSGSIAATT
jgi:hypothetical protein